MKLFIFYALVALLFISSVSSLSSVRKRHIRKLASKPNRRQKAKQQANVAKKYDKDHYNSVEYLKLPAETKMFRLWAQISENKVSYPSPGASAIFMFTESMLPTFTHTGDAMPDDRVKYIHAQGNVAKVEYIPEKGQPYTGVFAGAKHVLLRMSTASVTDYTKKEAANNFAPGFGIKFLRDKVPSANLQAMFSVEGVDSWNVFGHDFSNHIPDAMGKFFLVLGKKFSQATSYVGAMGLKDLAEYDEAGNKAAQAKYPYKLIFKPTDVAKALFPAQHTGKDLMEQLKTVPQGTVLYDVIAIDDPKTGCQKKIGSIRTKNNFITSNWGDQYLFFRHNLFDEDIKDHPTWEQYSIKWSLISSWRKPAVEEGDGKKGCPFRRLYHRH